MMPFGFIPGPLHLRFTATVTRFNAPQSAALDDLQIAAWFPVDSVTDLACRAMII
jgi:hypothetical protein